MPLIALSLSQVKPMIKDASMPAWGKEGLRPVMNLETRSDVGAGSAPWIVAATPAVVDG
jgi:hypothetical protein